MKIKLIVAFCALLALAGCGVLEYAEENKTALKLVTSQATLRHVSDGGQLDRDHAIRVLEKAKTIKDRVSKDDVTSIDTLVEFVAREADIDDMAPADAELAMEFLKFMAGYLSKNWPEDTKDRTVIVVELLDTAIETLERHI